jgi:hypothetical protein
MFNFACQKNLMKMKTNMRLGSRLMVILCLMGVGLIVASVISVLLVKFGLLTVLTVQDVLAFIVPAIAAMAIFYHRPIHAMGLDRAPSWKSLLIILLFYIVSIPAMNWLVHINEAMTLPSWMSGIESWMRESEDSAAEATKCILDINTIPMLLVTTFVVGFMAGLSEEMLFRGAMLRTMKDSRLDTHAVVWIVAIIFSAFHMQFYGFVPRMVLGLWLGYLFVWSGSLWVPIIAHTLNNSNVVFFSYLGNKGIIPEGYGDNIGIPVDGSLPWLAIASLIASIAVALWASRCLPTSDAKDNNVA